MSDNNQTSADMLVREAATAFNAALEATAGIQDSTVGVEDFTVTVSDAGVDVRITQRRMPPQGDVVMTLFYDSVAELTVRAGLLLAAARHLESKPRAEGVL